MFQVRGIHHVDFDGAKLTFFPNLSRCTLIQRRALKSLLQALQDTQLSYRWGFPFSLSATKDGQQFTLRNKDDLPQFLDSLGLTPGDIPDWRASPEMPLPPCPQPWHLACSRQRNGPRGGFSGQVQLPSSPRGTNWLANSDILEETTNPYTYWMDYLSE